MKTLCVIPARGGSKTVPGKNLQKVGEKHLIEYVTETVLAANIFDKIILSTDSEEIASTVKRRFDKIEVPFLRPDHLANDEAPLIGVSKHALLYYREKGVFFDIIFSVQPTCPFLSIQTLHQANKIMASTSCDSVVSIARVVHFHPFRTYNYEAVSQKISPLTEYTKEDHLQKQDRPDAFGFTGGVYGRRAGVLEKWNGKGFGLGDDVRGVLVSEEESFDIDTGFDMEVFESLIHYRGSREK